MGVRTCGRVDGHAEADDCKKRKKRKEKEKTHWCSEWVDGRVDVLQMGMHG